LVRTHTEAHAMSTSSISPPSPPPSPPTSLESPPASSLIQLIKCCAGKKFEAHPRTTGLERKFDLIGEDGTTGAMLLWNGGNIQKSEVVMGDFEDRQRGIMRRVKTNHKYGVSASATQRSFEVNGRSISETGAVLFATGSLASTSTSDQYFAAAERESLETAPGMIGTFAVAAREGADVGACYLFADSKSMSAYLEGAGWKQRLTELPWEQVNVQTYCIAPAAAA